MNFLIEASLFWLVLYPTLSCLVYCFFLTSVLKQHTLVGMASVLKREIKWPSDEEFEGMKDSFAYFPLFHPRDGVFNNNSHLTEVLIVLLFLLCQRSTMVCLERLASIDFDFISLSVESEATISSSNCKALIHKSASQIQFVP